MQFNFDSLYPDKKLKATRRLLRDFWNNRIRTVYSSYPCEFEYRQAEDINEMAYLAAHNIEVGADMPGFNIPRLVADFGTVSTAAYWGGKTYTPEGGRKWIDPIISGISDLEGLAAEDPENQDVEKARRLWQDVSAIMGTSRLPCTTIDLQGPLNTLALMWEQQDFMISMYENPGKVHEALEKVTDHLIRVIKALKRKIPMIEAPLWPYIWLPGDIGIGVTEDYMPLLSPELYKEFGIPYVKRLSDEFGGLFIHCCGQFTQHIDSLAESSINILGMEFVYPHIDIPKLFKTFGSASVFVPNIMDKCIPEFGSMTGYYEYIESLRTDDTRLWYVLRPDLPDFAEQVKLMDKITDEIR